MPLTDHRTQIYLTESQHRAAKRLAARRGLSLAGVVREALSEYLAAAESQQDTVRWAGDPAAELVGSCELPALPEDRDLDEAIDESVYDEV